MTCEHVSTLRPIALAVLLALAACINTGAQGSGQLVIVGGGLRAENAEVFGEFLDDAGQRILVLPTASGVPERSGPGTVANLERHAASTQTVEVAAIEAGTPERAFDSTYVRLVEGATAAWFTGGVQSRILAVFRPDEADSPAYLAVRDILEREGTVGGSSAGAAMMSDPMIARGNSREALLCSDREMTTRALTIQRGMGFFPYGPIDQHFLRRGRIGRLVVALEHVEQQRAYGVAENSALVVDLATGRGRALGERGVVVVDAGDAERDGFSRRGVRVSLLSSGDAIDLAHGTVFVDPEKRPVAQGPGSGDAHEALGPWDRYALSILMERLSRDPRTPQRATGDDFTMVLRADAKTSFMARDGALADFTVVDAILDIEAQPGAARAAATLELELATDGR